MISAFGQSLGYHVTSFDNQVQHKVELDGYGTYGSNVMDLETMQLFYRGGYFDQDLKSESVNRLGVKNLLGAEYGFQLGYENPSIASLDSLGLYVSYGISGAAGVTFTHDLFNLVFVGNQQFVGDSAFFSGTEFSSFSYRKIGVGILKLNKDGVHKIGLSLISFGNYSYGIVDRGMYQADANSDTLELRLSGSWMTDSKANHGSPVGYGIGFDYEAKLLPVQSDSLSAPMLICGVRNLGVFFSTKSMNTLSLDTSIVFSGLEVNNISDFSSDLFEPSLSGDSLLPAMKQERKFRVLPFELYFYAPSDPNGKKMQLVYGMRYRHGVSMIPQIYFGGDWRPNPKTIISPYLSFGGYSYFKTGLAIRKEFGNTRIGLVFNNVPGFLTQEAYQQSIAISMSYGIK